MAIVRVRVAGGGVERAELVLRVGDAVRPGIVRADCNAAGSASLKRQQQAVVARRPARIDPDYTAVVLSIFRILQSQPPALICSCCRRAWVVSYTVQGAGSARNVHRRVDRLRRPEVDGVISEVAC